MRKSWPVVFIVIIVGALAGVAIAGRPVPADTFVLDPSVTVPLDVTPSTEDISTTVPSTKPATTTTTTRVIATDQSTTSAQKSTSPTASTGSTTTEPSGTTTTIAGLLPRDQVRLVLANGDGRFRLSSITADRLTPLGYIITLGDALKPVGATVIYYRPGFEDEAAVVAKDLPVPKAVIAPFPDPSQPVTNSDDAGDVIAVLGPDAPR
jgi:hypothetical protein